MCSDGRPGTQLCRTDGTFASCVCPVEDPQLKPCLGASEERCDGLDNDCDGRVDDGEICPDATVASTTPFSGGVYLQGTTAESVCGKEALRRFWPALAPTYFSGFDCYARWYRFRRSDQAIYYQATFAGIRQDTAANDPVVSTPPCHADAGMYFDFDAAGTLYYQCADTVRRGDGLLVASSVLTLVATLDDGRIIVTRAGPAGTDFAVLDASGQELSRLSPHAAFLGMMTAAPPATTVAGNRGYVAYLRRYTGATNEIVVFRVDEGSAWSLVRRAVVPSFGYSQLVLSDGTIFVRERDPSTTFDDRIVAYMPDGLSQIVWREAEQTAVRTHGAYEMLIGPP